MRIFLLLFFALIVAAGSGYYLMQSRQAPGAPVADGPATPEPEIQTEIFVPAAPISAGSLIRPEDLRGLAFDDEAVTAEMIRADEAGETVLHGSVARQPLAKGVPIARSAIVQPGDRGFLAAVLTPGRRAIAVAVSDTSSVGGHVLPGDRVDIIMTYSVSGEDADAERDLRASETLLTGLRVLALDREFESAEREARVGKTITLEVTSRQAEIVTLARRLGDLSLVLNSVRAADDADGSPDIAMQVAGPMETVQAAMLRPARVPHETSPPPQHNNTSLTLDYEISSLLNHRFGNVRLPEGEGSVALEQTQPSHPSRRIRVVRGVNVSEVEMNTSGPMQALSGENGENAE